MHAIFNHCDVFALEPIKSLSIKLQKRNQDIYKLVDETIDSKSRRADIDDAFDQWYIIAKHVVC